MTIAMVTNSPKNITPSHTFSSSYLLSSSYLVVLKRYLDLLHPKQSVRPDLAHLTDSLDHTITIEQLQPTLRSIEEISGHACFGLDIGRHMHPSDYGIFGYAMMNCENLLCALKTAAEHKTILNQKLNADFIYEGDDIIYQVNCDLDSKDINILTELDFSTAYEFAKKLAGPHQQSSIKLSSVHFSHEALGPIKHYTDCFQCPVFFNEPHNRIRIKRKILETPIYGANPKVLSSLENKIIKITKHPLYESLNLSKEVAFYVRKSMSVEIPSAQDAARYFNMSLSSIKKRLAEENTSYQKICDEVRFSRCSELMKKENKAIKEIAIELGFANASAFNKAFKRWTGCSPSEYKNKITDKLSAEG